MSPLSSVAARPLYTHFLFFPKRDVKTDPQEIDGVQKKDVVVTVGDGEVHGWFFRNPKSPYVVLVNHGNGGNISNVEWIARNVLSTGVSVLIYDYRGYGQSKGSPTAQSICTDGDAMYSYLRNKENYSPQHIILYGQSLGCAVACHIASMQPSAGIILQSGFSSLRRVAYQRFPILRHVPSKLVPDVLDNRAIVSRLQIPLLIIHGDNDKVVPFCNANDLFGAAVMDSKKLVICPKGGHRLFPQYNEVHREALQKFIEAIVDQDSTKVSISASTDHALVSQ